MTPASQHLLTLAGFLLCKASCSSTLNLETQQLTQKTNDIQEIKETHETQKTNETKDIKEIKETHETLLIGGNSYSHDLELLTEQSSCVPAIPEAPVGRKYAAAARLPETETILYCGGEGGQTPAYHAECHTISLKKSNSTWETAPSMNHPRGQFTLEVIKGIAYAIGGNSDLGVSFTGPTVEMYTPGGEWEISTDMQMPHYRRYHCSTSVDNRIVVIGGDYGGSGSYSRSVIQYDIDDKSKGWTHLTNTHYGRQHHACLRGFFQGQDGIYVTGGSNSGSSLVEFYVNVLNKWRKLPSLISGRDYHTMSLLAGSLFIHGDGPTQEVFNVTWTKTFNLRTTRSYHTSISLPAATLKCI